MKVDEIKALEPALAGDFRTIEQHLQALDKHLTLSKNCGMRFIVELLTTIQGTYLDGYTLGDVDTKIWQALRGNRAAVSFIKRGSLANLARWVRLVARNPPQKRHKHAHSNTLNP